MKKICITTLLDQMALSTVFWLLASIALITVSCAILANRSVKSLDAITQALYNFMDGINTLKKTTTNKTKV